MNFQTQHKKIEDVSFIFLCQINGHFFRLENMKSMICWMNGQQLRWLTQMWSADVLVNNLIIDYRCQALIFRKSHTTMYISLTQRFKNDFEDFGLIGTGGFADVHKVKSKIDSKYYAAKIIKIRPSNSQEQTQQRVYRALQETRIHSQLNHPQILKYHGCWMEFQAFTKQEREQMLEEQAPEAEFEMVILDDSYDSSGICFGSASSDVQQNFPADKNWQGKSQTKKVGDGKRLCDYKEIQIYILSELCEMNLQTFLYDRNLEKTSQEGRVNEQNYWAQNCSMALDLTKGLNHLHSKRIIHRDIKLHNVVLNNKHHCKLIDFGLARKAKYWKSSIEERGAKIHERVLIQENDQEEEEFSKSVGTKLFSSPQQASSARYDYRTDIFSIAIVIVLLFCTFTTAHQQRDLLDVIRQRKLDNIPMPIQLKDVLNKCLGAEHQRPSLNELQLTLKTVLKQISSSKVVAPLCEKKQNLMRVPVSHQLRMIDSKIY